MMRLPLLLLLLADAPPSSRDSGSLDKPALSWKSAYVGRSTVFRLMPLKDGWLGLVATKGKVQFRSPAGEWSEVFQLPVDEVRAVTSAGSDILVAVEKECPNGQSVDMVLLVSVDGRIHESWTLPEGVFHSIATWKDTRWATISDYAWRAFPDGLLELLPGGKIVRHAGIPAVEVDVRNEVPWNAVLHLGPAGERIFCVPHECGPDFCHFSYCYRGEGDKVVWQEFGQWWSQPDTCGEYLLERGFAAGWVDHLLFSKNRTVVRRLSDGAKVGSIRTRQGDSAACAGPDEFLLNQGDSITSLSLPTGRRRWSVPVPKRAGNVVALARTGTCTIALTHRNFMVSICPGADEKMVTTVTR
jgi:hypothetical protein